MRFFLRPWSGVLIPRGSARLSAVWCGELSPFQQGVFWLQGGSLSQCSFGLDGIPLFSLVFPLPMEMNHSLECFFCAVFFFFFFFSQGTL